MVQSSSGAIADELRTAVAELAPGAQLPSSRELVGRHGASPVTVNRAVRQLVAEGLIDSRPGVGMFVRPIQRARPVDYGWQTAALRVPPARTEVIPATMRIAGTDLIAMHSGYPDASLLPARLVHAALRRASRSDAALVRPPVAGLPELQGWFARELAADVGTGTAPPAAGDAIVLPGSQSALSTIFRALVGPGQALIVESPTYWGAIQAAVHAGVRLVPVPSGGAGPDPGELRRAFAETGARVVYAQPQFANPTGGRWSQRTALDVLEIVREHGAFLVEDDWARDFAIDERRVPLACRDDTGHVLYLRSLTKSVSPSIRVAAVIVRGPARERILADRAADSMYVSGVLQAAALEIVTDPAFATHRRAVARQLRERRDLLLDSLAAHAPGIHVAHVPEGGLSLWARLPDGTDVEELAQRCERAGLLIAPGGACFPAEPAGPYARLSFAGPDPGRLLEAARILGRLAG